VRHSILLIGFEIVYVPDGRRPFGQEYYTTLKIALDRGKQQLLIKQLLKTTRQLEYLPNVLWDLVLAYTI
jgi:hypothetical protein